jgi:uncharacterized protein (TIGR00288 family)
MPMNHRAMIFVDGENILIRYEAMKERGFVPVAGVVHLPGKFVWLSRMILPGDPDVIRVYHYTTVVGDEDKLAEIASVIKSQQVRSYYGRTVARYAEQERHLTPVVFKKPQGNVKAKGVDILMTVDILSHVYRDNLDAVYLFSGDGDYHPILEEAIRHGKYIVIGAFSDGLSPVLRNLADEFFDLDATFFDLHKSPVEAKSNGTA